MLLVVPPEIRNEGEEQREDLQAAGQHEERVDPEGGIRENVPRVERSDEMAIARAHIGERSDTAAHSVHHAEPHRHESYGAKQGEAEIAGHENEHVANHGRRKGLTVDAEWENGMRVKDEAELIDDGFPYREDADTFDTATRAASTGSHHRDKGNKHPGGGMPQHEVFRGEPRCRLYGYGVERAESDGCFPRAVVHEVEHKSPHYGHTNEDEQEAAQLAVLPYVLPAAFYDGQIQQREIDAGKEHEEDEDVFNLYRIKESDARLVGGETSRTHGGERVADGVERSHANEI